jgi:hypothetical protein
MKVTALGLGLFGAAAASAAMAGAAIWLLLMEPVTMAEVASAGEFGPAVEALVAIVLRAVRAVLQLL